MRDDLNDVVCEMPFEHVLSADSFGQHGCDYMIGCGLCLPSAQLLCSTWFAYLVKRYHLNDIHEIPATMSVANFVADPQYIQQAFATSEPFFARQAGIETRVLLVSETGYDPYRVMFTDPRFSAAAPPNCCRIRARIAQGMATLPRQSHGGSYP